MALLDVARYYSSDRYRILMFRSRGLVYLLMSPYCFTRSDLRRLLRYDLYVRRALTMGYGVAGVPVPRGTGILSSFSLTGLFGIGFLQLVNMGNPYLLGMLLFFNLPVFLVQRSLRLAIWGLRWAWWAWRRRHEQPALTLGLAWESLKQQAAARFPYSISVTRKEK
jgi:hypothetical protein